MVGRISKERRPWSRRREWSDTKEIGTGVKECWPLSRRGARRGTKVTWRDVKEAPLNLKLGLLLHLLHVGLVTVIVPPEAKNFLQMSIA